MPVIAGEEFTRMNIMAGTARSLERKDLTEEDRKLWNRDFDLLVNDLQKIVDAELGVDLKEEKEWYTSACEVAKGYFDKPFGGLKSSTGQFGFRLLAPQDFKTTAAGTTPAWYSWVQTATTTSAKSYKTGALGYGGSNMYCRDASGKKAVIAFHRLISYKGDPRLIYVEWNINGYPYAPYAVVPFSNVRKADKLYRVIPMPGRVLLHPGGYLYATLYFDRETGATVPSGTKDVDIEVAPFGLVFGEYDYLAASELV